MSTHPRSASPKAYQAVLDAIEADLRAGRLRVGEQLPGERALAEQHGISRASVRDAIRILDVMGVVRTSTGSGPKAGAVLISEPAAGISTALRMHVASASLGVEDIVQTRILLETWAARAASELAAEPVAGAEGILAEAARLVEGMEDDGVGRQEFHDLDARFHVVLASLSGNAVITAMMESLRLSIRDYVSEAMSSRGEWDSVASVLKEQHRRILAAVAERRGDDAAELLREHIEWFHREVG
ncbi:FadR/GntR family transcriptional regulator [Zhihengliuella flava]|uniref:DNA-binding FadR family transcriptional regulator n=1 Tax=Zhihengliuella flava TaxID=1285193 RepID=A0A931GFD4_9MICC|nr:FCD domain-containing protein [Zhihengliuella flava]MBG6085100.1 DNA-binding FadR family transcriptional regulator [Zhihengliuella flava]